MRESRMKIRNVFGTKFSGALGKDIVAVAWHGHEYIREYAVASNPNSERQRTQRGLFAEAMKAWRALSESQQDFYRHIADGMTGHNLFIKRFITALRNKQSPEVPTRMRWVTVDRRRVPDGALQIRKNGNNLFYKNLGDGAAEIALTASDAPYTVLLVKGLKEVEVLTIEGRSAIENPPPLENLEFGIRLVAAEIPAKTASNKTLGQILGLKPPIVAPPHDSTAGSLPPKIDPARADSAVEESLPLHPPSG
jgi:hypothetical protein